MLCLHGGLPRTGTSSLQSALAEHREWLGDVGVIYPERWIGPASAAHHELHEMVSASRAASEVLDELKCFLAQHPGRVVLFSTEWLTAFLQHEGRVEDLLGFLTAIEEVTPVRVVWCLRRYDEILSSEYASALWDGSPPPRAGEVFDKAEQVQHLFPGLRAVEEAVRGEVVYVRYDASGMHANELLRAFGISGGAAASIQRMLIWGPRHNAGPSCKTAAALVNQETLSKRLGLVARDILLAAIRSSEAPFETDSRCELVDGPVREAVHQRALAAAWEHGVTAYPKFFGDAQIPASTSAPLGLDMLTYDDMRRLAARL
jgi:hypothetical protein